MGVAHDLDQFALFFLFICAAVLVVVGVLYLVWRGLFQPVLSYLVEKGILQPLVGGPNPTRKHSVPGRWRHFIEIGILSVVLEMAALRITQMNTPGEWVVGWLCARANEQGRPYGFGTIIILPIVLDACMIFIVLWAAYSILMEMRGRSH
jgi:hypothetical protein